jgi:hypothetical protein
LRQLEMSGSVFRIRNRRSREHKSAWIGAVAATPPVAIATREPTMQCWFMATTTMGTSR